MATDVYSGASGAVGDGASAIEATGMWSIDYKGEPQAIVDSGTASGTVRRMGNKDWSGRYRANGATPYPLLFPAFTFKGSIDGTNGCYGDAVFDSIRINIDVAGGKIIDHEVSFSGNGALSFGAAAAADTSVTYPESAAALSPVVKLATPANPTSGQVWTALDQIETVTIEFKRENKPYVDSGTAGWTKRKTGPLDFTVSIKMHPDSVLAATALSSLPQPGSVKGIQVFVDGTYFYELNWAIFSDISGIEVHPDTHDILACTLNASMCGNYAISGTNVQGDLSGPGSSPADIWS